MNYNTMLDLFPPFMVVYTIWPNVCGPLTITPICELLPDFRRIVRGTLLYIMTLQAVDYKFPSLKPKSLVQTSSSMAVPLCAK